MEEGLLEHHMEDKMKSGRRMKKLGQVKIKKEITPNTLDQKNGEQRGRERSSRGPRRGVFCGTYF